MCTESGVSNFWVYKYSGLQVGSAQSWSFYCIIVMMIWEASAWREFTPGCTVNIT